MSLNILEQNLDNVEPEYRALYVKQSDGQFKLLLRDLEAHVQMQLKPLKSELESTQQHERKIILEDRLGAALRQANVVAHGQELLTDRLANRIKFETLNGSRVLKIMHADGETPMDGAATIDDLVKEATKAFPSMFQEGREMPPLDEMSIRKSDFKSEKERAAWVTRHGLDAYRHLDQVGSEKVVARKSEFANEKERAAWVNKNGVVAYRELAD